MSTQSIRMTRQSIDAILPKTDVTFLGAATISHGEYGGEIWLDGPKQNETEKPEGNSIVEKMNNYLAKRDLFLANITAFTPVLLNGYQKTTTTGDLYRQKK